MRIAKVIGTVTLSQMHPTLVGARWLIAVPHNLETLTKDLPPTGEDVVAYDNLGASPGSLIAISEGVEASMPFRPDKKPLDAYCACILDEVRVA